MSKPQDGFVSKFLNRPLSRFITRFLLRLPIHPDAWTLSIIALPILSCFFLIRGDYGSIVLGAAIFQVYSILDGCDGEIARAKNLESKRGEFLDGFCDFLANVLFVIGLGFGVDRLGEAILCATLIAGREWFLRIEQHEVRGGGVGWKGSFYRRHHRMIEHSGLLNLGEKFVWWSFQLTKRDVAILAFLVLALIGLADWILHLWFTVAGVSLLLHGIAAARAGSDSNAIGEPWPRA